MSFLQIILARCKKLGQFSYMKKEFPRDIYIKLTGLAPHYHGRVTLIKKQKSFSTEVSIVSCESDKIYQYIGSYFGFESEQEAMASAIQSLSHSFKKA